MGQALYRKYRSKTLDEVVGQEHITRTLRNALRNKTFSHAYLFTGPRGVGKTSIARILAHEVNNLPYDESKSRLDIIEIDAASNRRIDEIRDLRDKIHIAPTSAKYKVYIIDEVHMLTKEAFNALLKTLEEPPEHAIFILATTEFPKVPETIISRTQHFTFKPISKGDISRHLFEIAKNEKIDLKSDAADLIAEHSGGSFRDSISLLDRLQSSAKVITPEIVQQNLGIAPDELIDRIISETFSGSPASLVALLDEVYSQGHQPQILVKQVADRLKIKYLKTSETAYLACYRKIVDINNNFDVATAFEICLLEAQLDVGSISKATHKDTVDHSKAVDNTNKIVETAIKQEPDQKNKVSQQAIDKTTNTLSDYTNIWEGALMEIKKHHNTLYSLVRMAQADIQKDTMILSFKFPFHLKQINEPKNINLITKIVSELASSKMKVICKLENTSSDKDKENNSDLITINNIFGRSEVLES